MTVSLTSNQEARLAELAARGGARPESVATELLVRALEYEEWFLAQVEQGQASLRRGEGIEHDEVVARIGKILAS